MKKIFILFVLVFLFVGNCVLAEETTTTTNTTITLITKEVNLPLTFKINKWFLELRKKITNDPVTKAKIDTQILQKENQIVDKMVESNKINVTDKIVTNLIQRKENISNQLEKLKSEGQKVDDLINQVKTNTLNENSVLYKKLQNATEEQKNQIIERLEKNRENIQARIEVKDGVLQNIKTDEELKNLKEQVNLHSEERIGIYDNLINLVKDKVILMTENQKSHFINYLKLKISKLNTEGLEKIKSQITDGTIKVELENIIDKIIDLNKPVINQIKKEEIGNKKEERKNIINTVKQEIQELKKTGEKVTSPEERHKILNEIKDIKQEGLEKLKELNPIRNMQGINDIQKPAQPIQETLDILKKIDQNTPVSSE